MNWVKYPQRPSRDPAGAHATGSETLAELCSKAFDLFADKPAVTNGETTLSYAELEARSDEISQIIQNVDRSANGHVAVCLEKSVDLIPALIGIVLAGRSFVPIDPREPPDRVRKIISKTGLTTAVARSDFAETWPLLSCIDPANLPSAVSGLPGSPRLRSPIAYCMFTSGSTGTPKGVLVGDEAVINLLDDWCVRTTDKRPARCSTWTPISFDVFVYEVFTAIVSGSELCITPERIRPDPVRFAAWLHEECIDSAFVPAFAIPSVLERIIAGYRPSILLVGVEPISERLLYQLNQHAPDLLIINGYGPTEATVYCTTQTEFRDFESIAPIGKSIFGADIHLCDEDGAIVEGVATGEILIGGRCLSLGYLGSDDTARFVSIEIDGRSTRLFRTGDRAKRDAEGIFHFLGRTDNQVKISGIRVELEELEHLLSSCFGVSASCISVVIDGAGRKCLAALVVIRAGYDVSDSELREYLNRDVQPALIPRLWCKAQQLPRTAHGKIDRKEVGRLLQEVSDLQNARTQT